MELMEGQSSESTPKRKANWSKEACLYLLHLISEKKHIVEGKKFNNEVTAKARKDTWEEITNKINAAYFDAVRDKGDVEKKWWALKGQGREELSQHKKILGGTGGGKAPKPLSEVAIVVEGILGADNASIGGIASAPRHDAIFNQIRNLRNEEVLIEELPEEGLEEQPQLLEVTWVGSTASVTVPQPMVSTPLSSMLQLTTPTPTSSVCSSNPLYSLSQPSNTRTSAKCELFPAGGEEQHLAKKRRLELELTEVNVEVGKAQLDLCKAQAALCKAQTAKAELEKKVLELDFEHKALMIKEQRASIGDKTPNSSV
ncbi:hypothetical protein Pcinc_015092 [Petrolisthes cinctipes]|uniref:Regulatory protein zeste n=1 Tax=Petrolisthes cinctipes TaxID=88211 RepID=A0AAE1FTT6_PETCI|nr:hypothetical protein Pcinc_015092 [Petrolisthes cinctipes]